MQRGSIDVEIRPTLPVSKAVRVSGEITKVLTDDDLTELNITEDLFKRAVEKIEGKYPTFVYLKKPKTSEKGMVPRPVADDQQITKTLTPVAGSERILSCEDETIAVARKFFHNTYRKPAEFTADLSYTESNSVNVTWNYHIAGHVNFTVGTKVGLSGGSVVSAETSSSSEFGVMASVAQGKCESKSVTVSSASSVKVPLDPDEKAVATLTIKRRRMKVQVDYLCTLGGDIRVQFGKFLTETAEIQSMSVKDILKRCGLPDLAKPVRISEIITVDCIIDADTKLLPA